MGNEVGCMFSRLIFKYNTLSCKAVMLPIRFNSYKSSLRSFKTYEERLSSSVSRSKSKIFDYACNNYFKYFITITCNSSYDSYNLEKLRRDVSQIVRDLRKKYKCYIGYILIPEKHEKGDFHLHGLFTKDIELDFYKNEHCYLSVRSFDKIGFTCIENIRNYEACCKYITKYITKDLFILSKGKHAYFVSNGLETSKNIYDLVITSGDKLDFDFKSDYCSIKDISLEDSNHYIDYIFNNHFYNYYNNITSID